MDGDATTPAHELYHQGLRNMHAEKAQAIETMSRQVERLENYPDLASGLRKHIDDNKQAQQTIERMLGKHGTSTSSVKEAVTGLVGNLTGAVHAVMGDEVLKNTFANYALESHEIAAFTSLIAMAEAAGVSQDVSMLRQMMQADQAMSKFLEGQIVPVTQKYIQLEAAGAKAGV